MRCLYLVCVFLLPIPNALGSAERERDVIENRLHTLMHPIKILDVGQWRDGGSIYVVLIGANGAKFDFWLNRNASYPIGRLYVSLTNPPDDPVMVPPRSGLERELALILKEWLALKIDPVQYRKKFPDKQYSDSSLLGRHRYYVAKIIESVEASPDINIFGAVPQKAGRKTQSLEEHRFKEAIKLP